MQLRNCFMHWVSYVLVLATIPTSKANYDAQLALLIKEMDMDYGERLSSLEEGQLKVLKPLKGTRMMKTNRVAKRSVYPFLSSRQPSSPGATHSRLVTPNCGEVSPLPTLTVTPGEGKTSAQPHSRSTRCTTSMPLPKLNPWFIPSNENINFKANFISVDENGNDKNPNKYIAPKPGQNPQHYIDDEK